MSRPYTLTADADLRTRNTFGIAARALLLAEVHDAAALPALFRDPQVHGRPVMAIGGGSNLLFAGDPEAVLVALTGQDSARTGGSDAAPVIRADAGLPWHALVMRTLAQGLAGLENLALIPGTVGAAPIQNIGAYGVEVGERIHAVEAWERDSGRPVRFDNAACRFGYRDSLFKREPDRWIVTAVEFALSRAGAPVLGYAGIGEELAAAGIAVPTPLQVAEAVIRLRRRKLPDPARIGNAGSFFKNPIVPQAQAVELAARHSALPVFPGDAAGTRKLSAAWLIDACGWKGHRDGDAGVSAGHALVLVNHGEASGADLLRLAHAIAGSVQARFGIALEPEPRIVGARW